MLNYLFIQRRVAVYLWITLFILLSASCGNLQNLVKPKQTCSAPPALNESESLSPPSASLTTDIFLDATLSMQGFITEGSLSYYQQTIALLERPIINNGGQANFYKFGTGIKELSDRSYREADKKSFYTDGEINRKTLIENVLNKADASHLTIVITDLFQEKSDIDLLNKLIKQKYIANNLAVGVLGIKSQFSGPIYDVGTNNYSFTYAGNNDPVSYRPFYLLAFGQHADISKYFNSLANTEMSGFPFKKSVIFSSHLTEKFAPFSTAEITKKIKINTSPGSIIKAAETENQFKEFKISSDAETASFAAVIPFQRLSDIPSFNQLRASVQNCSCQNNASVSNTQSNSGPAVNSSASPVSQPDNQSALEITNEFKAEENKPEKEQILVNFKLSPAKLDNRQAAHCFHITLHPSNFSLPSWISDWNMSGEQVETYHSTKTFDGSRTYNLAPFLQTVLDATVGVHNPKTADFYCYFKQN